MASNFEFYSSTRGHLRQGTEQRVGALVREYGGTRDLNRLTAASAPFRSGLCWTRARKVAGEAGISSWAPLGGVSCRTPTSTKVLRGHPHRKEVTASTSCWPCAAGQRHRHGPEGPRPDGLAEPEKDVCGACTAQHPSRRPQAPPCKCLPVAQHS